MGSNLKELCKLAGIKQDILAKKVGVSQGIISSWSNDRYYPSAENLIEMTKILNVTAGCILGLEPIPEGYPDHLPPVVYNVETHSPAKVADVETSFRPKKEKIPFTEAQISYLEHREDRLVEKITAALKEDTFLLKETGTRDE